MKNNQLEMDSIYKNLPTCTPKKVWSIPAVEVIGYNVIEGGNASNGPEGAKTSLFNGKTFTGIYHS